MADAACRAALISLYVALRRRRILYGLTVDTKGITTVVRNSPIAFGWCTSSATSWPMYQLQR